MSHVSATATSYVLFVENTSDYTIEQCKGKNPGNSSDNDLGSNKKWGKENKVEMVGMTKRFLKHGFYAKNKEVMKNEWSGKVKELKKMKNHFSLLK